MEEQKDERKEIEEGKENEVEEVEINVKVESLKKKQAQNSSTI